MADANLYDMVKATVTGDEAAAAAAFHQFIVAKQAARMTTQTPAEPAPAADPSDSTAQ